MRKIKKSRFIAFVAMILCVALIPIQAKEKETAVFTTPDTSFVEVTSSRHTQPDSTAVAEKKMSTDGFEKKLENDALEVWFRESSASIRIVVKSTGYIWGSLTEDKGVGLNTGWSAFANSLCTIEYYNKDYADARISLSNSGIKADYKWTKNQLHCSFNATKLGISLAFTMTLDKDSLAFAVDEGSLAESGSNVIKSLYFVPFLGSTYKDEINGYMFVPDGCGALIRYNKSTDYVTGFNERVYGLDAGIDQLGVENDLQANRTNDYMVETQNVTMPVYGLVHGAHQNALFTVIEGGQEYSSVVASVAGVTTNYNWVTARFDYRQMYTQAVADSGSGFSRPQVEPNSVNPAIRIYFLSNENADYSGMARLYREKLINQGMLTEKNDSSNIPMRLEVVASEVKDGFLWKSVEKLTSSSEASGFVDELQTLGIDNITMVMRGWQNGGLDGADYSTLKAESKTGGMKGLTTLRDKISGLGGKFYLYVNPVTANEDQISLASKAAVTKSDSYMKIVSSNKTLMYPTQYFIKIGCMTDFINKAHQKLGGFSLSIDKLGAQLYADYSKNQVYSRTDSESQITALLANAGDKPIAMYSPNQYCWKYTNEIFDIPMDNSQYLYETDTVPFLQMVLKGYIDYYAPFSNQGFYSQNSVLKMIEYATYPSFITMNADNYQLSGTPLTDYFSLNFEDWKGTMESVYKTVNGALSQVTGQSIVSHQVIESGVVKISYSGGTAIYVNYNSAPVLTDGIEIPAVGYFVQK